MILNFYFYIFFFFLDIEQEKEKVNFINGIENFDSKNLKHAETCEKNPLPTKEVIEEEKKAVAWTHLIIIITIK